MKRGLIPPDDPLWQLWGFFLWDNTFGIAIIVFPDWLFVVHASSDPRRLSKLRSEPLPLGREFFGVVDYELSGGGGIDRGVDARVR
jgi:hypothetical protein